MNLQKFLEFTLRVHLFSYEKRGMHNANYIDNNMNKSILFKYLIENNANALKIITIAPEIFSEEEIINLKEKGYLISAGHTICDYKTFKKLSESKYINFVTHYLNAMPKYSTKDRKMTITDYCLIHNDHYLGIICDGNHISFKYLKYLIQNKLDKLIVTTDGSPALGFEDGTYLFGSNQVVKKNNKVTLAKDNSVLAGSCINLIDSFKKYI